MIRTRTTSYVTLLSVVLALALTAALAACGSDEPSGVTGPDRDRVHHRVRGRAHCHRCGCDSAARGLRLRRNGPGGAGCPLQRNGR